MGGEGATAGAAAGVAAGAHDPFLRWTFIRCAEVCCFFECTTPNSHSVPKRPLSSSVRGPSLPPPGAVHKKSRISILHLSTPPLYKFFLASSSSKRSRKCAKRNFGSLSLIQALRYPWLFDELRDLQLFGGSSAASLGEAVERLRRLQCDPNAKSPPWGCGLSRHDPSSALRPGAQNR